jgi:hypothetical protein
MSNKGFRKLPDNGNTTGSAIAPNNAFIHQMWASRADKVEDLCMRLNFKSVKYYSI